MTLLSSFGDFYVFVGDIEKMYRQLKVNPTQTFLQNILWRDHSAAPVCNYLADFHKERYPLAAQIIHTQCYVDDTLYGCDTLGHL